MATKRIPVAARFGMVALVASSMFAASCGGSLSTSGTMQAMEPVGDAVAAQAESGCWFKVKNRSSRSEEVRLWSASSSTGARTERLGELLIVTGAMAPAVHDARFYGCSLFEYTPGSPVVMMAKASNNPIRADSLIPYGFAKDGKKELK